MKKIICGIFTGLLFLNCHIVAKAAEPTVHIPYFSSNVVYEQTAIFWFGKVTPSENFTDVRIGYNNNQININTASFDRYLWYDTSATPTDLAHGDSVTLYLSTNINLNSINNSSVFKFTAQLNWWEGRTNYQAGFQGGPSGWQNINKPFTTETGWRGNAPNDSIEDRGWTANFYIPFTSLGLTGSPTQNTEWRIALVTHDRDDASETSIPDKFWPVNFNNANPASWNLISFGLPLFSPPETTNNQTVTIRNKLYNAQVSDAQVGGYTICGEGLDFWTEWGEKNYSSNTVFNIQNQSDVADWPCFSKFYVSFPLSQIPAGKTIKQATLTLHQMGNSDPIGAQKSFIQAATFDENLNSATINWNNAPSMFENFTYTWVDPLPTFPGWPGVERNFDVSPALNSAYTQNKPLDLVLYSSDSAYHSGKYFVSSATEDWNEVGRPTLTVIYGDSTVIQPSPSPSTSPDINNDGKTNTVDFGILVKSFGTSTGDPLYNRLADLNTDGKVDFSDAVLMLRKWLGK